MPAGKQADTVINVGKGWFGLDDGIRRQAHAQVCIQVVGTHKESEFA